MSEKTPWYVEHSKKPKGEYGAIPFKRTAESNPENRRGVSLHHHKDYGSKDIQRTIADGLAILREAPERVVMVGGDLPSGKTAHYHIQWNDEKRTYELVREGQTTREAHQGVTQILNALDEIFPDDSFVCVLLIYTTNSPFNVSKNAGRFVIGA